MVIMSVMGKPKKDTITAALLLGAIGVVFGDIGTSPLYALQAVFGIHEGLVPLTPANITGVLSLIIWAVTIEVSVKYVSFVMRVNNQGEGGIIALISLLKAHTGKRLHPSGFILLGLVGVALFYGETLITPAISVLSAVEGVRLIAPDLSTYIIPTTIALLAMLFGIQRFGTSLVGRFFGPIMLLWFYVIGLAGLLQIIKAPAILVALSPLEALGFIYHNPLVAFFAMSAVTLAVTGAEALYADMGHFGRRPIARAWALVVFPSLALCYLGQGSLLLENPANLSGLFFLLFAEPLRLPVIILAAAATLIASQAVISGAYSMTRQAVHLDFLPKMTIRHTSDKIAGQVYIPFLNLLLCLGVISLVVLFGSSQRLAAAYGVAVSITLAITALLFILYSRTVLRKPLWYVVPLGLLFITLDLFFIGANISKLLHGGWIPVAIAVGVLLILTTWIDGKRLLVRERRQLEGPLADYIAKIHTGTFDVTRVKGEAVFIGHHADFAPLALHASVEMLHELHERVVLVTVEVADVAHIPLDERVLFDSLNFTEDGICHVLLKYGYHDSINVPKAIKSLRSLSREIHINPDKASYFVSLAKVVPTRNHEMSIWRKKLFAFLANNSTTTTNYLKLPSDRTVELQSFIEI